MPKLSCEYYFFSCKVIELSSNFKRFLNINIYPKTGIVQLEINIYGLNIPKISLDCLELTDESVLNINLIYQPNVTYTYM